MTIRPACPAEADRLTALAHAAKRHWGYPERWIAAWRDDLTLTPAFLQEHDVFVAAEDDEVLGFYALAGGGPQRSVEHLWVRPEAMGRGLGRALFEHAVQQAAAAGVRRLEIEADPHAEDFYRHLGARRVGERVYELEGRPRVLPVLIREIDDAA